MKNLLTCALLLGFSLVLAACGAMSKSDVAIGHSLVKDGKCAEAQPYLESTIQNPQRLLDLGLAYYLEGSCAEKSGDLAAAYKNYYATKVIACFSVDHDEQVNLNTYGRAAYCDTILPEKLKQLEPKVGAEKTEALRKEIDKILHQKYMEKYYNPK
ncbi:hypothetical protein [Pseudodesulfovibrio sp.]|uniref:hypothetical protein n=1 Tax=unclassified Pseudodesulfovibrio TaxID=2661612 RepID=UPI003B00380E